MDIVKQALELVEAGLKAAGWGYLVSTAAALETVISARDRMRMAKGCMMPSFVEECGLLLR